MVLRQILIAVSVPTIEKKGDIAESSELAPEIEASYCVR